MVAGSLVARIFRSTLKGRRRAGLPSHSTDAEKRYTCANAIFTRMQRGLHVFTPLELPNFFWPHYGVASLTLGTSLPLPHPAPCPC